MKYVMKFCIFVLVCMIGCVQMAYAEPASYEWGRDEYGDFIKLYDKDLVPLRVYVPKGAQSLMIARDEVKTASPAASPDRSSQKQETSPVINGKRQLNYFYYDLLNAAEKDQYDKIYQAAKSKQAKAVLMGKIDDDRLRTIFIVMMRDHPELFWLDWYTITIYENKVEVIFKYYDFPEGMDYVSNVIETETQKVIREALRYRDTFERVRFLYEYVLTHAVYEKDPNYNQTLYRFFVQKKSVCEDFALAMQYLLNRIGISSVRVIGKSGEHAWLQAKINGTCYNFDPTAGDPRNITYLGGELRVLEYSLFALSDDNIKKVHQNFNYEWDPKEIRLLPCTGNIDYTMTFKNSMLSSYYVNNYQMNDANNLVYTVDDFYRIMRNELADNKSLSYSVKMMVVGTKLFDKIRYMPYEEREAGYLGDVMKRNWVGYKHTGKTTHMKVVGEVYMLVVSGQFTKE